MSKKIKVGKVNKKDRKRVKLTHVLYLGNWENATCSIEDFSKIHYLGNCPFNGDMFSAHRQKIDRVILYVGHFKKY
jgi:hypothetical protein